MNIKKILEEHKKFLRGNKDGIKADLHNAYLSGAYLSNVDLRGADLSNAYLSGANLYSANLSGADLIGADLRWSDLRWSDLSGADLSGAILSGANLYSANLSNANLSGADLSNVDLRGADLHGTDLRDANLIVLPLPIWTVYIHKDTARIGCKHHSHDKWLSFKDREIAKMDKKALTWWKRYKPVIEASINILNSTKIMNVDINELSHEAIMDSIKDVSKIKKDTQK